MSYWVIIEDDEGHKMRYYYESWADFFAALFPFHFSPNAKVVSFGYNARPKSWAHRFTLVYEE